ncbi:C2H2 finger domain protein, putative [Talaromyces stipitatus ATCC 10500]|uniref:C2H2 finger domain protein, putative n=1 Tax=Talaromyces stipitatus (strain ATCC 10500 / CBS 375.48 / QM 6759 / NRRL 1006) TaxID=441959 RepID=B8M566_TALSN|nr:C2H2 finger domain protein, putative [Talaromyces stipitatus ATCC 10500]EED19672.1 C2H2 finger domain protein, putative [Talaromyces stipitatus ATCC 10500]
MESENMATLQPMNKCRSRHTSLQDLTAISRTNQDDEISQDHFSLSSTIPHSQDMDQWTLSTSDSMESSPIVTQPETPEVTMLSYSFSQQLLPNATGINDSAMFHSLSDIQAAGGLGEQTEVDYSQPHFAQAFASSLFEYNYENDEAAQRCMHDDSTSLGQSSPHEDGQLFSTQDTWNLSLDTTNIIGAQYDQISRIYSPPVSPPLTEASQVSVTSACSQPAYFQMHEEKINIQDSFHPLSPPLNDQDPNRTIRPTKQSQRPLLSATTSRPARKSDPEAYALPMGESVRGTSDKTEVRTPRDHPYYSLSTQADGKYYCPFATGENPCSHAPTTQKCAYHKYLDSHLKPYRCKVATCAAQNLHFSSNACLFRHEREAHGFHGHGDNPHLCFYPGCERAVPGYGFPRRWNLFDHMKRVHDYTGSEQPSSPESNAIGQVLKKKDPAGVRKRKVTKPVTATTMKRTKSASSQGNTVKVNPAQQEQRLRNAEQNYYNCRARLLEKIATITPQDTVMHEKANASLQELITLGLNFRQLEASSAATNYSGV